MRLPSPFEVPGPFVRNLRVLVFGVLVALVTRTALAAPPTQPSAPPLSQQTSTTFGDWVVRCVSPPAPATRACEATQSLTVQGQQAPVAEIAFAEVDRHQTITVLLPVNIAFDMPPRICTDEKHLVSLAFRRCFSAGCLANAKIDAESLAGWRNATESGRLVFTDASERTLVLPVSFHGLAQALSDLATKR